MYACIYELWKNCCGTGRDGTGGKIEGSTRGPRGPKKWEISSNKLTKLEIFNSTLDVEKMKEYTKGEGCGDDGDYLSWNEMQWSLHGE